MTTCLLCDKERPSCFGFKDPHVCEFDGQPIPHRQLVMALEKFTAAFRRHSEGELKAAFHNAEYTLRHYSNQFSDRATS